MGQNVTKWEKGTKNATGQNVTMGQNVTIYGKNQP
jgi:ribosomal protein L27